jgi:hypothetical protein
VLCLDDHCGTGVHKHLVVAVGFQQDDEIFIKKQQMLFQSLSLSPTHEALMVLPVSWERIQDISDFEGSKLPLRVLDYSVIGGRQGIRGKLEQQMAL